jgi:ribosomal protein S18 acetylase RimI-like enzyme
MEMALQALTYRVAVTDDLPAIAQLWLDMFEEVGKYREADFSPDWRARFCDYMRRRIALHEARYFVAEEHDGIAGAAGALVRDGYPMEISGVRNGYIFGVSVKPKMRGRGIATALTQNCVAWLKEISVGRILLHASPFGRPIYEKMGFIPTNEMELPLRRRL